MDGDDDEEFLGKLEYELIRDALLRDPSVRRLLEENNDHQPDA